MGKIHEKAYNKLNEFKKFKQGNVQIMVKPEYFYLSLFGRDIVRRHLITDKIEICDGNYGPSRTTAKYLREFKKDICFKKGQWFMDKLPWDGNWIKI